MWSRKNICHLIFNRNICSLLFYLTKTVSNRNSSFLHKTNFRSWKQNIQRMDKLYYRKGCDLLIRLSEMKLDFDLTEVSKWTGWLPLNQSHETWSRVVSLLLIDHPTNEKSMENLFRTAVSTSVNHSGNYICQSYVNEWQTAFSEKCKVANGHSTWVTFWGFQIHWNVCTYIEFLFKCFCLTTLKRTR